MKLDSKTVSHPLQWSVVCQDDRFGGASDDNNVHLESVIGNGNLWLWTAFLYGNTCQEVRMSSRPFF